MIDELKNDLVWKETDCREAQEERDKLRAENEKLKRMLAKEKSLR